MTMKYKKKIQKQHIIKENKSDYKIYLKCLILFLQQLKLFSLINGETKILCYALV